MHTYTRTYISIFIYYRLCCIRFHSLLSILFSFLTLIAVAANYASRAATTANAYMRTNPSRNVVSCATNARNPMARHIILSAMHSPASRRTSWDVKGGGVRRRQSEWAAETGRERERERDGGGWADEEESGKWQSSDRVWGKFSERERGGEGEGEIERVCV